MQPGFVISGSGIKCSPRTKTLLPWESCPDFESGRQTELNRSRKPILIVVIL